MKKIMTIVSLCILFINTSDAQVNFAKHSELLLKAHRAKEVNDCKIALPLYEEAFELHTNNSVAEYLNAADCAAQLNNGVSCKKWIIESISVQKAPKNSVLKFSKNELYQKCASEIVANYDIYLSEFYKSLENPLVYFEVQKLINRDQFARKLDEYHLGISEEDIEAAYEGYINSQAEKDSLERKKYQAILFPNVPKEYREYQLGVMSYTDSLNIVSLMDIVDEHGWQKEAWLLLWHQRGTYGEKNWVWDFFIPLINKEIENGKVSKSFWAEFEDFKSLNDTGKSIYGYLPGKVDEEHVNEKRKSIGLPVMSEKEIASRNNNPFGGRKF